MLEERQITLALHKPRGVVSTRIDPEGRRTVFDLITGRYEKDKERLTYVGRLDYLSEGLLLLTTDGELVQHLTHPSKHVDKEYHVWTDRALSPEEIARLEEGVDLGDSETQPCTVERLDSMDAPGYAIVLQEGRNRQIRRMVESVGARVERLKRVRIGRIRLGELKPGEVRALGAAEVRTLSAG